MLRRVEKPSALGAWSYEVIDTKLARETKGGTVLQLCLYADLVEAVQGKRPEFGYVVAPWSDYVPQRFRMDDYRPSTGMCAGRWNAPSTPRTPTPVSRASGTLRHLPLAGSAAKHGGGTTTISASSRVSPNYTPLNCSVVPSDGERSCGHAAAA